MEPRQTNDGKQQDLLSVQNVQNYYKQPAFISTPTMVAGPGMQIFQHPFQLVHTSPTLSRDPPKLNLLMGNRQLVELPNQKNLMSNGIVAMAAASTNENAGMTMTTKQMRGFKTVSGKASGMAVKCVTSTASASAANPHNLQQPQKIIWKMESTNGINNNPAMIGKRIGDRSVGGENPSPSQNTVIHSSRPVMSTGNINVVNDVGYMRNGIIQSPITMKTTGQSVGVGGLVPMQTINAPSSFVYYPSLQGTTFHTRAGQIRDTVNNNQSNISHQNIQKALPSGCHVVQLINPNHLTSQSATVTSISSSNAHHLGATQLITTQAPMSSEVVLQQKTDRPAILKRQRPTGGAIGRPMGAIQSAKMPKVDVEPVHIKVATGGGGGATSQVVVSSTSQPSQLPITMVTTSATTSENCSSTKVIGGLKTIPSSVSSFSLSNSVAPKAETCPDEKKGVGETGVGGGSSHLFPLNREQLARHQTVIRSPRKPRKQTLIRSDQSNLLSSRLSENPNLEPTSRSKSLAAAHAAAAHDEESTDEADECEDESVSENRANHRIEITTEHSTNQRRGIQPKRRNLSPSQGSEKNPFAFTTSGSPGKAISIKSTNQTSPLLAHAKSDATADSSSSSSSSRQCVRLRIYDQQCGTLSAGKRERDALRHFGKPSDVKTSSQSEAALSSTQLRTISKCTSAKVAAVQHSIRAMQSEESAIATILTELKLKMANEHCLSELLQSNIQRAKEGVIQLNESHAAACRLLSHYLKVDKNTTDKKEIPLLKKLLKKAKQKF